MNQILLTDIEQHQKLRRDREKFFTSLSIPKEILELGTPFRVTSLI